MKHARKGIHTVFDATKIVLPIASKKIDVAKNEEKNLKTFQGWHRERLKHVWNQLLRDVDGGIFEPVGLEMICLSRR